MGTASSHPQPPLIALNGGSFGKHNNILLPPEAFAHQYGKRGKYDRNKNSKRQPSDYRRYDDDDYAHRPNLRRWRGRFWDESLSESFGMRPRRGLRPRRMGRGGGPVAGGMPTLPVYYDPRGVKAMSAPELPAGYGYPVLRGGRGMKPMANMGPGMRPGMMRGYPPGPGMPEAEAYMYPQTGGPVYQGHGQVPPQVQPHMPRGVPRPPTPRLRRGPGVNDIAYGAHVAQGQPPMPGRHTSDPQVSRQMNRAQPLHKRAGPSGQEWIAGDPWLDACTCTTNCHCRKGARVLYRAQGGAHGDEEAGQNTYGEIRYVVKDDLGKDCGDHSKCRAHDDDPESSDGGGKQSKKKKEKAKEASADVSKICEQMAGLRNDLANMKLGADLAPGMGPGLGPIGQMDPRIAGFGSPLGGMLPQGDIPDMANGMDPRFDPRMAQMGGTGPFDMELPPRMQARMNGMMKRRPGRMPRPDMAGPMGESDIGLEDMDFLDDEGGMVDPRNGMLDGPPQRRNAGGRRPKQRRGPGFPRLGGPARRPAPDLDSRMEYPRPPRRGDGMNRPSGRWGRRPGPPPPDYDLDGGSGSGVGSRRRPGLGQLDDDDDDDSWAPRGSRLPPVLRRLTNRIQRHSE